MTVEKVDTFKMKGKRKEHPMARKYPGHPSQEFGNALTKFLMDLEPDEMEAFKDGTLVFEEAIVSEFYDAIQEGDKIGLGVFNGVKDFDITHPCAYKFEVTKVHADEDRLTVKNISFQGIRGYEQSVKEIDLYFEDISHAFGAGFADILERDGKMFGVEEEIEYKIAIYGETDVSGSAEAGTSAALPAATTKAPEEGDTSVESPYIQNAEGVPTVIETPEAPDTTSET